MPNFNLKGEAGKSAARPAGDSPSTKSSGGAVKSIVIILFAVIILGGAAFFLNKAGIIKLWGKKPAPQMMAQQFEVADTSAMAADTTGLVTFTEPEAQKPKIEPSQKKQQPSAKKDVVSKQSGKQAAPTPRQPAPAVKQPVSMAKNIPTGSGPYSIQLSSWASREKAEMEVEVLKQKGQPAFVQEGFVSGLGHRYRVNVGRFASESAAREEAQKSVAQSGYLIIRIGN